MTYIRDSLVPVHVSREVYRWLKLLAEAEEQDVGRKPPADEIADRILRQAIREQHPQLAEHQKQIEALEKAVLEKLKSGKSSSQEDKKDYFPYTPKNWPT